ncbi:MAG TPA: hypothetical protein VNH40_10360, partial [Gaiellaceae bacterium]|nr:hypothetical protein [Gaiellaceae bacterium]
ATLDVVRIVTAVGLVLATLVFAATASARDPKDPRQRHTAAATQLARSIALKRSDLATGWKAAPKDNSNASCSAAPDESNLVQTARIDQSFVRTDGVATVGSEIDIFSTTAQAKRDWQLSTLTVVGKCLLESARRQLAKQHVTVTIGSADSLTTPKLGERSLHYRLVFLLSRERAGKREVLPYVTELIGLGIGRTSVVLHASSWQPLPSSGLLTLAKTLAKRLVAASGGI